MGNLTNNGIGNYEITNANATVDNSGKLGQCYSFNGSSSRLYNNNVSISNNAMSGACWVKLSALTKCYLFSLGGNGSITGAYQQIGIWIETNGHPWICGMGSELDSGYALTTDKWYHLCMTYSGSTSKLYINGSLVFTGTNANSKQTRTKFCVGARSNTDTGASAGIALPLNGKLNDVRIYDHALSPNEIEILSRGLVVHYPMTGGIGGQSNLIPNSSGYEGTTGWGNSGLSSVTVEDCPYGKCIKITSPSTASARNNLSQYITSTIGTNNYGTYTLSFYYKAEMTNVRSGVGAFVRFANTSSPYNNRFDSTNSLTLDGQWHFCSITQDISNLNDTGVTSAIIFLFAYQGTVWYSKLKLELGTKSTPYVPYSGDNIYTSVGYNDNIEYDVSGNNYHGTKTNVTYDSDTPRYVTSTKLTTTSGVFSRPSITLDKFTIAFWGKHTASNKMLMGSCPDVSTNNTSWYWYGDNSFRYPSGEFYYEHNAGTYTLNTWMHFVATYDGSNIKVYRNGVYEGSKSATGTMFLDYLSVGRGYGSNYAEAGNVSDFHLYATCLSADQVKRLYNTAASLSNNGTLMGYEFVEQ